EAVLLRAVDVQYADEPTPVQQGDHNLRLRRWIAYDVAFKLAHITDYHSLTILGRFAANSLAYGDAAAGRAALEGAEHQFVAPEEVKSHPAYIGQQMVEQCRGISGIRKKI